MPSKHKTLHLYHESGEREEESVDLKTFHLVEASSMKRTRLVGQLTAAPEVPHADHSIPTVPPSPPVNDDVDLPQVDGDHGTEDKPETRSKKSAFARIELFLPKFANLQDAFMSLEADADIGKNCTKYSAASSSSAMEQDLLRIDITFRGRSCHLRWALWLALSILEWYESIDHLENYQQLLLARYFPATTQFPNTAFTFQVLETFHQLSLSSKITSYDYFDTLKKITSHAFPQEVEDQYKELLAIMRVWRILAELRRSGVDLDIDELEELEHRRDRSLAVRCPACPEPGFNVSLELIQKAPTTQIDPNDFPLNQGNAYFVDDVKFQEYLKVHDDGAIQNSTCSKLKAVWQQHMIKFTDTVYSGVVATQFRGETYVQTDYALASALGTEALQQRWIMLSYDVWCQYLIHLLDRMKECFPHLALIFSHRVRGAIPKMHIHGHGMTCGEGIESAWAEQNHAASSTKEQSTGHRQDTLDDFNAYWNWTKVHRLSNHLLSQFTKYWDALQTQISVFDALSKRFASKTLVEWEEMWKRAEDEEEKRIQEGLAGKSRGSEPDNHKQKGTSKRSKGKKEEIRSVFQVQGVKVPTRRGTSSTVQEPDHVNGVPPNEDGVLDVEDEKEDPTSTSDLTELIEEAIEIEYLQLVVHEQASKKDSDPQTLGEARQDLGLSISSWRTTLRKLVPSAQLHPAADFPENDILELPSSYSFHEIHSANLITLARFEFHIRLGHAYDGIDDIRSTIHIYNACALSKRIDLYGQTAATRAWTILYSLKSDIRECTKRYRLAFTALSRLGLPATSELKSIQDSDLWGKDMTSLHKQGDSKRQEPWFWVIGKPKGHSDEQWQLELDRVRWFRTRALRDCLTEEVQILTAEFQRTIKLFTQMDLIWTKIGDRKYKSTVGKDSLVAQGYRSFSYRQAHMYRKLAQGAEGHWAAAVKHAQTTTSLISS
ncbi:hypothetical protein NP233_g12018 [Leucocoprinus birnbaumii]|uniref:CxC2-like cysteine cluster KDZ transposase-associated domain-containing protein n=1 Tax=Leucocoprinus birnbaumii TaxID=56174 RepID=A0AAD5VHU5_9AGAR|nr:hypothetical protein NP233_g12018 [Leucocoprinus birnbaumii]